MAQTLLLGVVHFKVQRARLKNIVGFHKSAIGQSHFPTIVDIVLGSLRFSINAHTRKRQEQLQIACHLLEIISPLFIRANEETRVLPLSFALYPKKIDVQSYRLTYDDLCAFLASAGLFVDWPPN